MAHFKVLFVLFLGLFITSQADNIGKIDPELYGIVEEAEKLLKELQQVVESAIQTALKTIQGFLSEIGAAAAEFEKELNATLVAAIGPFIKQIENAVHKAAEAGVDVAECTGDSLTEIEDLPAQLLKNVTSCVANKVNEANDVINGFIDDIQNTTNVVLDLGNQIRKCEDQGFINLALCLGKVTANISVELVKLPIKITGDIAKATKYVALVIPSFAACDFGAHASLVLRAGAIAGNVTSCIADKMSSGTTQSSNSTSTTETSNQSTSGTDSTQSSNSTSTTETSNQSTSGTDSTQSNNSTSTTETSNQSTSGTDSTVLDSTAATTSLQ